MIADTLKKGSYVPFYFEDENIPMVSNLPVVTMLESGNFYKIGILIPGMDENDFAVAVESGQLLISAENHLNPEFVANSIPQANRYFESIIELSDEVDADKIAMVYRDGELTLTILKRNQFLKSN